MTLPELQLGRVFDRDDSLVAWYVARHHVEERGLTAARAAAYQNVRPRHHTCLEEAKGALAAAPEPDQVVHVERPADELADVEQMAVDRHRRNRRVNPRAVQQACVTDGVLRIDPAANRFDYEPDHIEHLLLACEGDRCQHEAAVDLDIDITTGHHHYLGYLRIGHQGRERSQPGGVLGLRGIEGWGAHCVRLTA